MMNFEAACRYVGIPPTSRQRRKFRRGFGMAYRAVQGEIDIPDDVKEQDDRRMMAIRQLGAQ